MSKASLLQVKRFFTFSQIVQRSSKSLTMLLFKLYSIVILLNINEGATVGKLFNGFHNDSVWILLQPINHLFSFCFELKKKIAECVPAVSFYLFVNISVSWFVGSLLFNNNCVASGHFTLHGSCMIDYSFYRMAVSHLCIVVLLTNAYCYGCILLVCIRTVNV